MTERDKQRLAKVTEKLEQIKAQRKDILSRENKRQRNERTRRLIQIGALTEKYFDLKDIQPTDYEKFLQAFIPIKNMDNSIKYAKKTGLGYNE